MPQISRACRFRSSRWLLALLAMVLAALGYRPAADVVFAARLMLAVRSIAAGADGKGLPIIETRETRRSAGEDLHSLVYRPSGRPPVRALVLVPGITEQGCYDPRLMAIARHLAANEFLVLTPDIRPLREFRVAPQAIEQIAFWALLAPMIQGNAGIRTLGLSGISFSATLAVMAAARPELQGRVAYVFGIGAYDDPVSCSRFWLAPGPVTVGPGYYPTRFYGKWILMLAALELVPDKGERRFLEDVLTGLLLQKPVPEAPETLSPTGRRWYRLAVLREDESDPELAREIEGLLRPGLFREISPERAAAGVRCPVFLVHGAYDDLIPPDESRRLMRRFVNAPARLLITPFLTHTHPVQEKPGRTERIRAVLEIAAFFYAFAGAAR